MTDQFIDTYSALEARMKVIDVIANNLANVNTPGYKRQDVQFEEKLAHALDQRRGPCAKTCLPLPDIQPIVTTQGATSERSDGNNVDVEQENVNLAVNTLRFETLTQSVGGYFTGLKSVINGR